MRRLSSDRVRVGIWTVGALAALAYYAIGTFHPAHRTPAGTECRLFGCGDCEIDMLERPSGGSWIVVVGLHPAAPSGAPPPPGSLAWNLATIAGFRWPDDPRARRGFGLFPADGTWALRGSGLRYLWAFPAESWPVDRYLVTSVPPGGAVLDLDRRRSFKGEAAAPVASQFPAPNELSEESYSEAIEDQEYEPVSPLEELSETALGPAAFTRRPDGRRILLLWPVGSGGMVHPLVVAEDQATPRFLRLLDRVKAEFLSHDGRTLFFTRDHGLWRLDLRKPLPEMLDEPSNLPLPAPPEAEAAAESAPRGRGSRGN